MWNLSTGEVSSKDKAYVTGSVAEVKHVYDHRIPPKVKVKECDKRKELDISISSAEDSESVVKPSSNKLEKEKSVSSIVKGKPPLPSSSQVNRVIFIKLFASVSVCNLQFCNLTFFKKKLCRQQEDKIERLLESKKSLLKTSVPVCQP